MRGAAYQSWGRYPPLTARSVARLRWRDEIALKLTLPGPLLAYGLGRSYGDVCLNEQGRLLDTTRLDRFLGFDETTGILTCEAGVSLEAILDLFVPRGWFVPVTPGTRYVTVGGAVANDIHGKEHHVRGTFGCHVVALGLRRSDGAYVCTPTAHHDLFRATIGGLGLTGLIEWVSFRLIKIPSPCVLVETAPYGRVENFFSLAQASHDWDYTVAWFDSLSRRGRGIFYRGRFVPGACRARDRMRTVPITPPAWLLNPWSVGAFNIAYYTWQRAHAAARLVHYLPFFYPLDGLRGWNRLYGRAGFVQHQSVIPAVVEQTVVPELLARAARSRQASFLTVIKKFGDIQSPGLMSFPLPGTTVALDFPWRGGITRSLLDDLDAIVASAGGRVYPAKDAHMSRESFQRFFPQWRGFSQYVDPAFSSSFWRRVNN